jgi:hypothetical protein
MDFGIKQGWVEKGLTEDEMNTLALKLPPPPPMSCALSPYYLNYLQNSNTNDYILQRVKDMRDPTTNEWVAANNLWTPGQTINIVFSNNTAQEFIKGILTKYLQPHVSMKLNFPGGSSGDILVNVASGGNNSSIGKTGRQQTVNLNASGISSASMAKVPETINTKDSGKFYYPRYIICHEFGHAMGLFHEWQRSSCRGSNCSADDLYSVMNYFAGSSGGDPAARKLGTCMDSYSPTDIQWLEMVYKGGSTPKVTAQVTTPKVTTTTPQITPPKVSPKAPNMNILPKKQLDVPNDDIKKIWYTIISICICTIFIVSIIKI